jgi:uncharacterized protein YndB with AHSA1/START domain
VGSTTKWNNKGVSIADPAQVVLKFDPYQRLSYRWHTVAPELDQRLPLGDERFDLLSNEHRSRITFEIEPLGKTAKLTVIHDHFEAGGMAQNMVRNRWPVLLSSLKTLLEIGEPLSSAQPEREA